MAPARVLLSHARVHGDGIREPHRWSDVGSSIARRWIGLRYRLLPYLLGSARASAAAGLPFARPLLVDFQDDPTTWRIGDEFICGEALLVALLFEPGGRRRVYLPPVRWYGWEAGEALEGGTWFEVQHALDSFPVFVREGAIVPMGPEMAHVGERPTDPLTIRVAPFGGEGETLFETRIDGHDVRIRYRAVDGRHELAVSGASFRVAVEPPADA